METSGETICRGWFRERLSGFIRERHPRIRARRVFVDRRSFIAMEIYRLHLDRGSGHAKALAEADSVLFEGLLFSRFDTILAVVAEFPGIPARRHRHIAYEMIPLCDALFDGCGAQAHDSSGSSYRRLCRGIAARIREYIGDCGYTLTSGTNI